MNEFNDKNLLIIANGFPAGTLSIHTFVKGNVDALKEHFNEIYVISPYPRWYRRELRDYSYDNVRVYYPRFFHVPIELFRKRLGDNFFKAALKVIKREKLEFDLIHAHFTWPAGYAAVKLGKEYGVPSVITIHENRDWFLEEYKSGNEKIYWTWKNADALIRVNQKDVPLLKKINQNVYAIPNGFDPHRLPIMDRSTARKILGIPLNVNVVFSLGNLIERKGFRYLIMAMREVVNTKESVMCIIGGSGPLRKELEALTRELKLEKNVRLIGRVPDEQLKYWMNAADLFVLPSLSESFGLVVLEAMAVGTPVIATINGGSEEILISDDYGFLCPPRDSRCLAEKILVALEKEWDEKKIREYAEQFRWDNIVKNIITIYTNITEDIENVQY